MAEHCASATSRKPYHCVTVPEFKVVTKGGWWAVCHRHLLPYITGGIAYDGEATVQPLDPNTEYWRMRRRS